MSSAVLDIHDCNLQLWHGDAQLRSPGYALLEGDHYIFGDKARAAARLRPRGINTRFWWQLGTEPLQPALGPARHAADLAHAHLQALYNEARQPDEIVFTTSSSMSREQLALLLGIANECDFAAVALINRSVALGSLHAATERTWHLELQLHQACLSELIRSDDQLELGRVIALPGCGMLQLQESLVKRCARAFIDQTRFDPLRKAASEQRLYDALPRALRTLETSSETNIDVDGYQARVLRSDLANVGESLTASVEQSISAATGNLLIDPLLTLLPGFSEVLNTATTATIQDVQLALAEHANTVIQRNSPLHYVTELPCLLPSRSSTPNPGSHGTQAAGSAANVLPTHLLYGHHATPMPANEVQLHEGWRLSLQSGVWQLSPGTGDAVVNAVACTRTTPVFAGDTITVGSQPSFKLIVVGP